MAMAAALLRMQKKTSRGSNDDGGGVTDEGAEEEERHARLLGGEALHERHLLAEELGQLADRILLLLRAEARV